MLCFRSYLSAYIRVYVRDHLLFQPLTTRTPLAVASASTLNAKRRRATHQWAAIAGVENLLNFDIHLKRCLRYSITNPLPKSVRPRTMPPPLTMVTSTTVSLACSKCGTTKKSGRSSCCARGGAWFKNCGDAGDTKFDHSWTEGIQACKGFATAKLSLHVVLRRVGSIFYPPNTSQRQNDTQQQAHMYHIGSMLNVGPTDSQDCVGLAKFAISICILCMIPHFHTRVHFCNRLTD